MRKENGINNKSHAELDSASHLISDSKSGEIPNQVWNDGCYNKLSFPRNVVGNLHRFVKTIRRRSPSPADGGIGDDNYLKAFTLIELLVVVLIIGILAAIALPQYQKAVERARASEALPLLKSVYQAAQAYQMANGNWPEKFDELAVEIPWTGNVKWRNSYVMRDTRSNDLWSMQIYKETGFGWSLYLGRISGKYKGAGFGIGSSGDWTCSERVSDGIVFEGNEGDYCVKIMRCAGNPTTYASRTWSYQP